MRSSRCGKVAARKKKKVRPPAVPSRCIKHVDTIIEENAYVDGSTTSELRPHAQNNRTFVIHPSDKVVWFG